MRTTHSTALRTGFLAVFEKWGFTCSLIRRMVKPHVWKIARHGHPILVMVRRGPSATGRNVRLILAHPDLADHPPRERLPGSGARDQHAQWKRHEEQQSAP